MSPFDIKVAGPQVEVDRRTRQGEVSFTVTNESANDIDGRALLRIVGDVDDDRSAEILQWLSIRGEKERTFTASGSHQYLVDIAVPESEPAGEFAFRLDMVGVEDPDDVYSEGQSTSVRIPEKQEEPEPKIKWWMYVAAGVVVVGLAVGLYFLLRPSNRVGPDGGEVSADQVRLEFPQGAVDETTEILIEEVVAADSIWPNAGLASGSTYRFGPEALQFDEDVTIEMSYDEDDLPNGASEGELVILVTDARGDPWREISTTVDSEEDTATAYLERFGFASLGVRADSVQVQPASMDPVINATVQVTATPRSASGQALEHRAIEWSSNRANIASVSNTGQVSARRRGTAQITAASGDAQGVASVDVKRYVYDVRAFIDTFKALVDLDGFRRIPFNQVLPQKPLHPSLSVLPIKPDELVVSPIDPGIIEKLPPDIIQPVPPDFTDWVTNEYRMQVGTFIDGNRRNFNYNRNGTANTSYPVNQSTPQYRGLAENAEVVISADGYEADNPPSDQHDQMGAATTSFRITTNDRDSNTMQFQAANENYVFEGRVVVNRRKE